MGLSDNEGLVTSLCQASKLVYSLGFVLIWHIQIFYDNRTNSRALIG